MMTQPIAKHLDTKILAGGWIKAGQRSFFNLVFSIVRDETDEILSVVHIGRRVTIG